MKAVTQELVLVADSRVHDESGNTIPFANDQGQQLPTQRVQTPVALTEESVNAAVEKLQEIHADSLKQANQESAWPIGPNVALPRRVRVKKPLQKPSKETLCHSLLSIPSTLVPLSPIQLFMQVGEGKYVIERSGKFVLSRGVVDALV